MRSILWKYLAQKTPIQNRRTVCTVCFSTMNRAHSTSSAVDELIILYRIILDGGP